MALMTTLLPDRGIPLPGFIRWGISIVRSPLQFITNIFPVNWAKKTIILLVMQPVNNYLKLNYNSRWWRLGGKSMNSRSNTGEKIPSHIPIGEKTAQTIISKTGGIAVTTYMDSIFNIPTTAHILGGACLGKNKNTGVIDENFEIKIKKNIPQKSGMGGGSMNAASVLKYLIKKKIITISNKKAIEMAYKVGSDVALGLERKNSILFKNGKVGRLENKINFHVLIVKPNIDCSTKDIYANVRKYSKPLYNNKSKRFFEESYLAQSGNDLENVVFKKYPKIKNLKYFISNLPNILFTRMTGSGSALVAYFKSKKSVNYAAKVFKRKYKNYWYIVSKTI